MAESAPQFENSDNSGSTIAYSGTATTTPTAVPASPGAGISQAIVKANGSNLEVSYDGGSTYWPYDNRASLSWDVKGLPTQLFFRTSSGSTDYDALINFEES